MSAHLFRRVGRLLIREMSTIRSGHRDFTKLSEIIAPVRMQRKPPEQTTQIKDDLAPELDMTQVNNILVNFAKHDQISALAKENGLDVKLFTEAFNSFRRLCIDSESLDVELHIILSDLVQGSGHIVDIFPYFLNHAKLVYPHLECLDDLVKIADIRIPANSYLEARKLRRKVIFHAGPTNSGKTFHALKAFQNSSKGVYCGPLKLLAVEVFQKTNELGIDCDLVTGDDRQQAKPDVVSDHVACTVEMTSLTEVVDVAVIDEIQMVRDPQRGWAWTRALLGILAKEVHLCGEEAAVDIVEKMLISAGEEYEIRRYERLTPLETDTHALGSLEHLQPGDCVVCFSKADIFKVSLKCEELGKECAVLYGSLPPNTKIAQAKKFNDPKDPCKILVATDAIGMGLNLSIRRIIFYSLSKKSSVENNVSQTGLLSVSQTLQIAGRAGRYRTAWETGYVTTMFDEDYETLKHLLSLSAEKVEKAGLHPSQDQVELFAYHLPEATMSTLINIFISISQVDSYNYFICDLDTFKVIADTIQHIRLPLRTRYVFCCAPVDPRQKYTLAMLVKFARRCSINSLLSESWLIKQCSVWPPTVPKSLSDLVRLEEIFDVCDLYLWLGTRFPDLFVDKVKVGEMQDLIDQRILSGISLILRNLQIPKQPQTKSENRPQPVLLSSAKVESKLTDRLLSKGLITKQQMIDLRNEWLEEAKK